MRLQGFGLRPPGKSGRLALGATQFIGPGTAMLLKVPGKVPQDLVGATGLEPVTPAV
jgi:hypothetical protein